MQPLLKTVALAAAAIAADGIDRCVDTGMAGLGMRARFQHQERADRTRDHAAAIFRLARPDRVMGTQRMTLDRFDQQDHVETFSRERTANQRMGRLSGLDAGKGGFRSPKCRRPLRP